VSSGAGTRAPLMMWLGSWRFSGLPSGWDAYATVGGAFWRWRLLTTCSFTGLADRQGTSVGQYACWPLLPFCCHQGGPLSFAQLTCATDNHGCPTNLTFWEYWGSLGGARAPKKKWLCGASVCALVWGWRLGPRPPQAQGASTTLVYWVGGFPRARFHSWE